MTCPPEVRAHFREKYAVCYDSDSSFREIFPRYLHERDYFRVQKGFSSEKVNTSAFMAEKTAESLCVAPELLSVKIFSLSER